MTVKQRQQIEKRIVAAAVKGLLAAGYHVGVDNGGDSLEVSPTTDQRTILEGLGHCDVEHLRAYTLTGLPPSPLLKGSVCLIYGEEGYDVMADYSLSLEPALAEANALADNLEELFG